MLLIAGVVVLACAVAALAYARRGGIDGADLALMALRAAALAIVGLLLLNPSWTVRAPPGPPTVLLDASLSMGAAGGQWAAARDSASALARAGGVAWRFGASVTPLDSGPPRDGFSRLRDALAAAQALGRPVVVVTDGELDDAAALPDGLLRGVSVITLARGPGGGAALAEVEMPAVGSLRDTIPVTLTVARWGEAARTTGALVEAFDGDRRVASWSLRLPDGSARARRGVQLPPGALGEGQRVVRFRLLVEDDAEVRDNERLRAIRMTDEADIVVIVDPADWEGRYLMRTLADVSGGSVAGYARIAPERWIDMGRSQSVAPERVWGAARRASLVVVRAETVPEASEDWRVPLWHWPVGREGTLRPGDWYPARDVGSSPLAGGLAGLPWDSVPPLAGIITVSAGQDAWVALGARQGRRGGLRPVLMGWEDATRHLVTTGTGAWRWAFRGGVSREVYRSLVAAGVDWLLGSPGGEERGPLRAAPVVARGVPTGFRWVGSERPDSVTLEVVGGDRVDTLVIPIDADGRGDVALEPGVYRWRAPGVPRAAGVAVVESYSDEFVPRSVATVRTGGAGPALGSERILRSRWWLVLLAMAALVGEWAWRQRRGFP